MNLLDPRYTAAIPTTARAAVPFTPKSLDPAKLRREQEEALDRDSKAIDKDEREFEMGFTQSQQESGAVDRHREELKARREKNAEHRTNLEKAHRELALRVVSSPTFMLKIPTPLDRDQLNVRLIEMGAQAIGQEQLRATMIEACFHYDWSDGAPYWDAAKNENAANENATFLDMLWQIEQAHNRAMTEWQEQEAERILDAWNGAPEREGDRQPKRLISVRDSARQILLMDRMMQTPMMRRITAKQVDYERRHRMILVRIALAEVTGIPGYAAPYIGGGMWEAGEVEALRQALDEAYGTMLANAAWEELIDRIARSYTLDGFEEKNSDSPLGNTIDQNSSVEPSGELASNDGTSTASSSSPIPSDASAPITEKPFDTGFGLEMQMAEPSAGPTDADSSTSQSN